MKKAIIYSRVSTTEQKNNGTSLSEQDRILREYCHKNNIEILKSFREHFSAKTFNRPVFNELNKYAEEHQDEIDYLLVFKWDRYSRNTSEAYEIQKKFKELSIEINSINEWVDEKELTSPLMKAIYFSISEIENRNRSQRATAGIRARLKEGRWCANAPTGYINCKDSNGKPLLKINKEIADDLKQLFEDFSTGNYSQVELIKKYRSAKLILNKAKLSKMLRNRFYVGEITLHATETEPEQIVKGLHEPLITKEVYSNIQRVLKGRRPVSNNVSCYEDYLPLRGILVNDESGKKLTGTTKTKKSGLIFSYYHSNSKDVCKVNVPAEEIHSQIDNMLGELKPSPEIKELMLEMIRSKSKSAVEKNREKTKSIEKEIIELEVKKEKLMDKYLDDQISQDDFEKYNSKYTNEVRDKMEAIKNLKEEFDNIEDYYHNTVSYFDNLSSLYNKASPKGKRTIISSILKENLRIRNKKYRTPKFKDIVHLICCDSKALRDNRNRKGNSTDEELPMVHPKRFELQTF
jgi:site-specific DNA recombinase